MTRSRRLALIGAAATIGALVPRAVVTHLPTTCPIRRITGYPCPSCGMVRSWHSILRLDPVQAVRDHPFGPIALAAISAEAWRPGVLEREMLRVRGLPAAAQAAPLVAWLTWWASRLVNTHRARHRRLI